METASNLLEKYVFLLSIFNRAGDKGLSLSEVESKWIARYGTFQSRTFHRQREALSSIFPVEIVCSSHSGKSRYYLEFRSGDVVVNNATAAWASSFLISKRLTENIELADRIRMSPEYGNPLTSRIADAISTSNTVKFTYCRDNSFKRALNLSPNTFNIDPDKRDQPIYPKEELEDIVRSYEIRPYFLAFESYWFLIGAFGEGRLPCVFCLDRIKDLEVTENGFEMMKGMKYDKVRENFSAFFSLAAMDEIADDRLMYIQMVSKSKTGIILL